jgi:AraC-like DNA-binding protein
MSWRPGISATGYTVEARIPFCVLSGLPFPPKRFGFDIAIRDRRHAAVDPAAVSWSGAPAPSRHSPRQWGSLVLRQALVPVKLAFGMLVVLIVLIVCATVVVQIYTKHAEARYRAEERAAYSPLVRSLLDCIDSRCGEPGLSLVQAAGAVGAPPDELERACVSETGAPFDTLLLRRRVRKAKHLLTSTGMTVDDVSHACGFAVPAEFSRAFLKMTSAQPSDYRRARAGDGLDEDEEGEADD